MGRPDEAQRAAWQAAGVDEFVYPGARCAGDARARACASRPGRPHDHDPELRRPAAGRARPAQATPPPGPRRSRAETGHTPEQLAWATPEGIAVPPLYTAADTAGLDFLRTWPGLPPFLRGPYPTMYTTQPWTIRQYAGFSTAEDSNAFYRRNLAAGQKGLSVAFDLATHRGYDSDHPRVAGDVGMAGVAIDSILDMRDPVRRHPARPDERVDDHERRGAAGAGALHRRRRGAGRAGRQQLSGTIQNDILKEFMVRNTYIYPPAPSMRIVSDIFAYTAEHMPKFNSICISGYHMQEAGATADLELAYTLADGIEYVRCGRAAGLDVDAFAPRLSFFWAIGMNFFMEVAKLRAARLLWAKLVKQFEPKDPKSLALRTHCQTSGWSLTAQDVFNNVARTCIEAMAATHGHTQSLHTNALDEALALPTDFSARIARNTQLFLQQETGITRTIDPWGGSYYVERLTYDLARRRLGHIEEVEASGGMAQGDRAGHPQAAHRGGGGPHPGAHRRRPADGGRRQQVPARPRPRTIPVLKVDNSAVRARQIAKLRAAARRARPARLPPGARRADRAAPRPATATCSTSPSQAARARATVGEITAALEKVWGRHVAEIRSIAGVYAKEVGEPVSVRRARDLVEAFAAGRGPAPAHPGRQDGPGRPRPRPEGDRHRLRRPRLRRRHRRPVPDPGRGRPAGGRQRRPHRRRLVAGRRPPDAGARAEAASSRRAAAATS